MQEILFIGQIWPSLRSRRRFIIGLATAITCMNMVCVILDHIVGRESNLMFSINYESEYSNSKRRLTEIKSQPQARPQMPLRPWLDPPPPLITGNVWNTTNIQWIGNSFYFPTHKNNKDGDNNFQLYTPHQIQKAFRGHSILLQGDSTVRRLYGTFHSILSYDVWTGSTSEHLPKGYPIQVPNPPFGIPATYYVRKGLDAQSKEVGADSSQLLSLLIHSPSPMDPQLLQHRTIVDVNKDYYTEICNRKFPSSYVMHSPSFDTDNSFKTSQMEYKVCRSHPSGGWVPPKPMPNMRIPLLYDYVNTNCLGHIHDFVSHELSYQQSITQQYSLYIVGPGVWETVKQAHCHHPLYQKANGQMKNQLQWPETVYLMLNETLEKLAILADQSPELLIVWRTSGYYDGDKQSNVIREMNRRSVEFIRRWTDRHNLLRKGSKPNFLCLDFGSAVERRSHGRQRLRGDMQAHYGLEVRVLQVQLLTNLLYENGYVI